MADITIVTDTESQTYIDPYNAKLFDLNVTDSRVYLSRQINNLLQVFGNNVVSQGLNFSEASITSDYLTVRIDPGIAIVDTTLHVFTEETSFLLGLTEFNDEGEAYDEDGYFVVSINYKYVQSVTANVPYFKLTFFSNTGTTYSPGVETFEVTTVSCTIRPDAWVIGRDNVILAAFDYTADAGGSIKHVLAGSTFIIDNESYAVNPRPELNANYLASLPVQDNLSPTDGGVLTWNSTANEWQSRAQEPGFVVVNVEPPVMDYITDPTLALDVSTPVIIISDQGASRNGDSVLLVVNPPADNAGTVDMTVTGDAHSVTITVTPDVLPVDLSTLGLREAISGHVTDTYDGSSVTITDTSSLLLSFSATGGDAINLSHEGEGDGESDVFTGATTSIPVGNIWMVDYLDNSEWTVTDAMYEWKHRTLKLVHVDEGNGTINGHPVNGVTLNGVWTEIPYALRENILYPFIDYTDPINMIIRSATQIDPCDQSVLGLLVDKALSTFVGGNINFLNGIITNFDQGSGDVLENFAPYIPTWGNWYKFGVVLRDDNTLMIIPPVDNAATKNAATDPPMAGGVPIAIVSIESQEPITFNNVCAPTDGEFDSTVEVTDNWIQNNGPGAVDDVDYDWDGNPSGKMIITAVNNNPDDIISHTGIVLTPGTTYTFTADVSNLNAVGHTVEIRVGSTFASGTQSDYDIIPIQTCIGDQVTNVSVTFIGPVAGNSYISITLAGLESGEDILVDNVGFVRESILAVKSLEEQNITRFSTGSGGGGGLSYTFKEDFSQEDHQYTSLLESSYFGKIHRNAFVDDNTMVDYNAPYVSANSNYKATDADGYIYQRILTDNDIAIYKFMIHFEGNDLFENNMTWQYSFSTHATDPEYGIYEWSTEYTMADTNKSFVFGGTTKDVWIKINFNIFNAECDSFGLLYEADNILNNTQVRLYETITIVGDHLAPYTIPIPSGGRYTEDHRSLSVYTAAGLRLTEGDHYNEVVGGRSIEFLYDVDNDDRFICVEYYGFVDVSWENFYRVNHEHSLQGEHILQDTVTNDWYKITVASGVVTLLPWTALTMDAPAGEFVQTQEVSDINQRHDDLIAGLVTQLGYVP